MDIEALKEYILENDLIERILSDLGCHHIKRKDGFFQAANPDGDNCTAICVYENTNLTTIDFTRDISNEKRSSDIISLVEYFKKESFPYAVKWICDTLDVDYYKNFDEDLPDSLNITKMLLNMQVDDSTQEEEKPLKPISEDLLKYYKPYVNQMFADDGVDFSTQAEFEIGYDEESDRIVIPIRDDIGTLVGVKGRYFYREVPEETMKFIYLEKCARSQILYGLYKTMPFIKNKNRVFVVEAEKGVLQLWNAGYCESVATGGKKITKIQIDKLTRLCVPIIFVFDKDVEQEELKNIADRFIDEVEIYALIDKNGILKDKESPTDDINKFKKLLSENVYKLK